MDNPNVPLTIVGVLEGFRGLELKNLVAVYAELLQVDW